MAISYQVFPAYPGTALRRGSRGGNVRLMQLCLERIRERLYPAVPIAAADGIYGTGTEKAVRQYQSIKGLAADGVIGRGSWNAIGEDYLSVWDSEPRYPGRLLTYGSTGQPVLTMQLLLRELAGTYTSLAVPAADGVYGSGTAQDVRLFQRQFGLAADGIIGRNTWNGILSASAAAEARTPLGVSTPYPGYVVRRGSTGDYVRCLQSYLNGAAAARGSGSRVTVDGIFGSGTERAVKEFQNSSSLAADGLVGPATWTELVQQYNRSL